jgi:hypothetical protein
MARGLLGKVSGEGFIPEGGKGAIFKRRVS